MNTNTLAASVVGVLVLGIIVGYCTGIIADTEQDVQINETESPEAAAAVDNFFTNAFEGIEMSGTIVKLVFVGILISAVMGFVYVVRQRG